MHGNIIIHCDFDSKFKCQNTFGADCQPAPKVFWHFSIFESFGIGKTNAKMHPQRTFEDYGYPIKTTKTTPPQSATCSETLYFLRDKSPPPGGGRSGGHPIATTKMVVLCYTYEMVLKRQDTFGPYCHLGTKVSWHFQYWPLGPHAHFPMKTLLFCDV